MILQAIYHSTKLSILRSAQLGTSYSRVPEDTDSFGRLIANSVVALAGASMLRITWRRLRLPEQL